MAGDRKRFDYAFPHRLVLAHLNDRDGLLMLRLALVHHFYRFAQQLSAWTHASIISTSWRTVHGEVVTPAPIAGVRRMIYNYRKRRLGAGGLQKDRPARDRRAEPRIGFVSALLGRCSAGRSSRSRRLPSLAGST